METQKIANLLGHDDKESSKFAARKWYVFNDQNNTDYGEGNENGTTIKFESKLIKSSLCDYSDVYIPVRGNITAPGGNVDTWVAFKNSAPFTKCITHINDQHVDVTDNLDIIMPKYNFIEYSDNYADTSGSLKEINRIRTMETLLMLLWLIHHPLNTNPVFFEPLTGADNGVFKNVKIAVPLKHLSNFWRSLEVPLINCKIHLELKWSNDCVMSTIADTTFKITNTKWYVRIVTLSPKDNAKLSKQLNEGFKRPVFWNEYKTKIESKNLDYNNLTRFPLDASFQGVWRLFVLAFDNTNNGDKKVERNSHSKYFLRRVNITN